MTDIFSIEGVTYLGMRQMLTTTHQVLIIMSVVAFIVGCIGTYLSCKEIWDDFFLILFLPVAIVGFAGCALCFILIRPVLYTDIRVDGSSDGAKYIVEHYEVREIEGTKWTVRYVNKPSTEIPECVDIKVRLHKGGKVEIIK